MQLDEKKMRTDPAERRVDAVMPSRFTNVGALTDRSSRMHRHLAERLADGHMLDLTSDDSGVPESGQISGHLCGHLTDVKHVACCVPHNGKLAALSGRSDKPGRRPM